MKLFSGRKTLGGEARAGTPLIGVSADSVLINEVSQLNDAISQLKKMVLFKPNVEALKNAFNILKECKSQINSVIQPSLATSFEIEQNVPSDVERPSFNRRP